MSDVSTRSVKFDCSKCKQHYEAPEDMADSIIECQVCKDALTIPRPRIGFYADPSESQLEEAELWGIQVPPGIFRGQLKDLIEKANNSGRYPTAEHYSHYYIRQSNRRIRIAQEAVETIELKLSDTTLTPSAKKALEYHLKKARAKKDSVVRGEAENIAERERQERENQREIKREEKEDLAMEKMLDSVRLDSFMFDYEDDYRRPSVKQYEKIKEWLGSTNSEETTTDIAHVIDHLFPELRK